MKKIFCILLVTVMMLGTTSAYAASWDSYCDEYDEWTDDYDSSYWDYDCYYYFDEMTAWRFYFQDWMYFSAASKYYNKLSKKQVSNVADMASAIYAYETFSDYNFKNSKTKILSIKKIKLTLKNSKKAIWKKGVIKRNGKEYDLPTNISNDIKYAMTVKFYKKGGGTLKRVFYISSYKGNTGTEFIPSTTGHKFYYTDGSTIDLDDYFNIKTYNTKMKKSSVIKKAIKYVLKNPKKNDFEFDASEYW